MWKSFWANPGANSARHLERAERLSLMQRAVLPLMSFRCSRWPPQRQIACEVDTLQQKMTASLLRLPRDPGELPEDYVRRRGRLARKICSEHGLWSQHWYTRARHWDEHLARPRNSNSWSSKLRNYRGKEWLIERRAQFSSASLLAGRTGTRSFQGKVQVRWHDGIDFAAAHANQ